MPRKLVNMRLPVHLLEHVDAQAAVLGQTRTKYVERALERALESALGGVEESKPEPLDHSVSAPVRAPVVEPDAFAAGEVMDPPKKSTGRDLEIPGATAAHHALMLDRQAKLNKRGKK